MPGTAGKLARLAALSVGAAALTLPGLAAAETGTAQRVAIAQYGNGLGGRDDFLSHGDFLPNGHVNRICGRDSEVRHSFELILCGRRRVRLDARQKRHACGV